MADDQTQNDQTGGAQPTPPPTATTAGSADAEIITKLMDDLDTANKQVADLTDTAKRALADLQNFKRQGEKDKAAYVQFATLGMLLELLPILDNFNRAFTQVPEEIRTSEWFKGALQIEQQLVAIVKKQGVVEIPSGVGKPLDPQTQEAITAGPGAKDTVVVEFEKGYMIGDRVVRPAKVMVGNGQAPQAQ